MHYTKLVVISDTALVSTSEQSYGFGPVVRELESIDHYFDEIIWIGYDFSNKIEDPTMQKISSNKIQLILLNRLGGRGFSSFLNILGQYPKMFLIILKHTSSAAVIHTRAPSHPALIAMLVSFFSKNKIWWHKYAGDWTQLRPPKAYGLQRWILKRLNHSLVTINGFWPNQPRHCISFENPCLTDLHISNGQEVAKNKQFHGPFVLAFIGRLDDAKGVSIILEALKNVDLDAIGVVHFIGDSHHRAYYENRAAFLKEKVRFHGFLASTAVHAILKEAHFLLLPSQSEGFPKVVAEAACYGVIPIVSHVGSITHYINDTNGFIWDHHGAQPYTTVLTNAIKMPATDLSHKSKNLMRVATMFTFQRYKDKLEKHIFKRS